MWWYEFVYRGGRYRERTGVTNKRQAEQIEAARRTQVANGAVGIIDQTDAPTLKEFEGRFTAEIETTCAEHPQTVTF